ncbi:hypothetical protein [Geobacter sp. DSM 9736]|uniref:hypothetical protein n=1 Tax=Geobacter sp. DSM 9736 TaxID=1277350 RepID=UPI000B504B21|nr:hypothetical protein [Geobacter sp. DSM 9736]SNB45695.1 hypothetical protein SAMN06269301_1123 [Geobacter sp. DSM 9736]
MVGGKTVPASAEELAKRQLERKIREVQKGGHFKGKKELLKFLHGEQLSPRQSIAAHCYECMGYYADGKDAFPDRKLDCRSTLCPSYPYNPYREGGSQKRRSLSPETRQKLSERMKQMRTTRSS